MPHASAAPEPTILDRGEVFLAGSAYRLAEVIYGDTGMSSLRLAGPRGGVYEVQPRVFPDGSKDDTGVHGIYSLTNGSQMRRNDSQVLLIVVGDVVEETTPAALSALCETP